MVLYDPRPSSAVSYSVDNILDETKARYLAEAGIGQVSELFDGDAPHAPRGCIAQAWSVAEVLRATTECRDGVTSTS